MSESIHLTYDHWHTTKQFALLAGINIVNASKILRRSFEEAKSWRDTALEVNRIKGTGRGGYTYKVNPETYPPELLLKLHRQQTEKLPVIKDEKKEIDHESRWEHFDSNLTNKTKDDAKSKLKVVQAYFALIQGPNKCKKGVALQIVAKEFDKSPATLRKWVNKVKNLPSHDWLPALASNWNPNKNMSECTPEAWEFFKGDYLRLEQPDIKACYIRLRYKAKAENWVIPSVDTFERWVGDKGRIPLPIE